MVTIVNYVYDELKFTTLHLCEVLNTLFNWLPVLVLY